MNEKIWRVLIQILYSNDDLIEIIKPFLENMKKESINDEKYIPFLETFSKSQHEVLYHHRIITKEKLCSVMPKDYDRNHNQSSSKSEDMILSDNFKIEEIISGDKLQELQELIQKEDINNFDTIIGPFKEVEKMKIPLLQYCIMKKAIECFKYLLINGYDDPKKLMDEQNPEEFFCSYKPPKIIKRYQWDCMATAIYFGNNEIIKILEGKGIEKGENPIYIEAAILSFRNTIAKEILDTIREENILNQNLNVALISSAKNNNIKAAEILIGKGVDINAIDIIY